MEFGKLAGEWGWRGKKNNTYVDKYEISKTLLLQQDISLPS